MQFGQLKRRDFITLLGGAAAWPFAAMAQEAGRTYRLGFVSAAPRDEAWYAAFFEELRGLGFVEDQNLTVIPGGFGIRNELLSELAASLVRAAPDAIIAAGPIATRAAQAATARRATTHVRKESLEAVEPAITHLDAAAGITRVGMVFRI